MSENNLIPLTKDLLTSVVRRQMEEFEVKDLGVEREVLKQIERDLKTPFAIVISGFRRSGKSTVLAQTAKKFYKNKYFYVNFEQEEFLNFKAQDFSTLHEVLINLYGDRKVFMFDEVQNISGWESFVRRLIDSGYKCYVTGSNASILSPEFGAKLTGRYLPIEMLPFSFNEYCLFNKVEIPTHKVLITREKGLLKKVFNEYLYMGGIPDHLKYPDSNWPQILYEDALTRDIVSRYKIEEPKLLKELSYYLLSNVSALVSFNKMKSLLGLGSVNTVKAYVDYLESAWLLFTVNCYAFSVKKQQVANKKIFAVDTGLVNSVAFSFSSDYGKFLENVVFLALKRRQEEVFYYKTKDGSEVDFYLPRTKRMIQVCFNLTNTKTKERELSSIITAAAEMGVRDCLLLTEDDTDVMKVGNLEIKVKPVYRWLLE